MRKRYTFIILALAVVLVAGVATDSMAQRARSGVAIQDRDRDRDTDGSGKVYRHEFAAKAVAGPVAEASRFENLIEKLQLTDEQIAVLQPLHDQMVAAAKAFREGMDSTLTDEQKELLRDGIKDRLRDMDGMRPPRPDMAQRQARFWALHQLDLTEDQDTALRTLFDDIRDQMKTIFEENQGDPEAIKTAVDALHEGVDAEIQNILTGAQYEEYQSLIETAGERMGRRGHGFGKGGPGACLDQGTGEDTQSLKSLGHRRAR